MRSLIMDRVQVDVMSPQKIRNRVLSRHYGKFVSCKLENLIEPDTSFADLINDHCKSNHVDIVIPVDVIPAACLAKIARDIAIPVFPIPTLKQILQLNHKWRFKQLLDRLGLATPHTILVNTPEEVSSLDIPFPAVIKPVEREHGIGLKILNSRDDLSAYFSGSHVSDHSPWLIQEYIPGNDICISVLCKQGHILYWTIQKQVGKGTLQFIEHPELLHMVRTICEELNYTGVTHFDGRIDQRDNAVKFLECNPRFWGSLIASAMAGIHFATLGITAALGQQPPIDITYQNGLRLPDQATNISIIALLLRRRVPFNPTNARYLMHTLCDPLLVLSEITKRLKKRIAKILIPGRIRRQQKQRRDKKITLTPSLSTIGQYATLNE